MICEWYNDTLLRQKQTLLFTKTWSLCPFFWISVGFEFIFQYYLFQSSAAISAAGFRPKWSCIWLLSQHSLCSTVYDMDVSFYLIENMSPTAHLVLTVYWYESLEDCCCCCCKNNNNNNKKTLWKRATKALIEKLHSSNTDCSSAKQHHVNLPLCSRMLHKFSAICVL